MDINKSSKPLSALLYILTSLFLHTNDEADTYWRSPDTALLFIILENGSGYVLLYLEFNMISFIKAAPSAHDKSARLLIFDVESGEHGLI